LQVWEVWLSKSGLLLRNSDRVFRTGSSPRLCRGGCSAVKSCRREGPRCRHGCGVALALRRPPRSLKALRTLQRILRTLQLRGISPDVKTKVFCEVLPHLARETRCVTRCVAIQLTLPPVLAKISVIHLRVFRCNPPSQPYGTYTEDHLIHQYLPSSISPQPPFPTPYPPQSPPPLQPPPPYAHPKIPSHN